MMVFLEPFDTKQQFSVIDTLRLAGYGVVVTISLLISYSLERQWYIKSGKVWHIANEVFAMTFLFILIATCTNVYHAFMFGAEDKSMIEFGLFVIKFVLPFAVFFFPVIMLLRQYFGSDAQPSANEPKNIAPTDALVTLKGENTDEQLTFASSLFCCAIAQQNYVSLSILNSQGEITDVLLRATLSDIHRQLPEAMRVHRSYLINPNKITKVFGSKRNAKVVIEHISTPIPIGVTYFDKVKNKL
ncbi:LytTR family DNA-binding domain-containing protein [Thalassotalea ponticola]|uniref:LytTR family DNA-binding domain-containing protein n=1 Tax=Thalassotalea ponticola TaxID=1523392 RepID=UPI0025B2ECB6|nr:LytTR family DNA-binding domain-containing protein [Thalassotalea ponticola]MDN3653707.1 LytTR family DNA-binding domain-containing protein [Thalassotalea ponticola]